MDLKQYVTIVPDYPKEGVQFKDITTLMDKGDVYRYATDQIVEYAKEKQIDLVVGPEARGFIIGCPVAYALGVGFAPVRKEGKLPREVIKVDYGLEYGKDVLTIHKDAIKALVSVCLLQMTCLRQAAQLKRQSNLLKNLAALLLVSLS